MQRRNSCPGRIGRGNEEGAALILTLLVLAILVVLVVQFTFSVKVEEAVVRNTEDDAAMELAGRGSISILAGLFRDDRKNGEPKGNVDTLVDIWCDPNTAEQRKWKIGDVEAEATLEDLERRLPLLWIADPVKEAWATKALERLIQKLAPVQVDPAETAKLIADKVKQLQGVVVQPGQQPGQPPPAQPAQPAPGQPGAPPAKRALVSLEQLLDAEGTLDRRVLYGDPEADPPTEGIAGYVTTWPVPKLNLNTILGPVLFAILPEKDAGEPAQNLWESADEIVQAVRARRIDPELAATQPGGPGAQPTPPAGGGQQAGEKGASRKWSGNPFTEVGQLQSADVHAKLAKVFEATGQAPGGGQPGGGGLPGGGQPGGGAGGQPTPNQLFKDSLTVESRYYAVKLVTRLQNADQPAPAEGEQGVESVLRLVLFRSGSDQVATLFLGESSE